MSKYDITVTLFTIVFGLMLTELFASLHKHLRAREKVKWHWIPISACWYLFLLILKNWWDLAIPDYSVKEYSIVSFLVYGHLLIVFYLLTSTALPDKIPHEGVNLKRYYFENHRYFWGLMALVILISVFIYLIQCSVQSTPVNSINLVANGIIILLSMLLAISKKYWLHSVLLVFFVVITLVEVIQKI